MRSSSYSLSRKLREVPHLPSLPANGEVFTPNVIRTVGYSTLIVGNGDVLTRKQGEKLAEKYQLDGIMIGRGIFHDPFVFAKDSPWASYRKEERIKLYRQHVDLFAKTWQPGERKLHTLNKFCKIYIQGFDGAKELREKLMNATGIEELQKLLA